MEQQDDKFEIIRLNLYAFEIAESNKLYSLSDTGKCEMQKI